MYHRFASQCQALLVTANKLTVTTPALTLSMLQTNGTATCAFCVCSYEVYHLTTKGKHSGTSILTPPPQTPHPSPPPHKPPCLLQGSSQHAGANGLQHSDSGLSRSESSGSARPDARARPFVSPPALAAKLGQAEGGGAGSEAGSARSDDTSAVSVGQQQLRGMSGFNPSGKCLRVSLNAPWCACMGHHYRCKSLKPLKCKQTG